MEEGWGFEIYHKYELIADVYMDNINRTVRLNQYSKYKHLRMFMKDEITVDEVLDWIEERCFPKTRANCKEILSMLGLEVYDAIDIAKATHGLLMDDYIWIKWLGEDITYDEIKIRE